jgi:hypothetical protein
MLMLIQNIGSGVGVPRYQQKIASLYTPLKFPANAELSGVHAIAAFRISRISSS